MKKATIDNMEMGDRLAGFYARKDQGRTTFEVVVNTRAKVDERVELIELGAQRRVLVSRWVTSLKVVHFTAYEWRYLRGFESAEPALIDAARQIVEEQPATAPASHAKTRSKPPASARD